MITQAYFAHDYFASSSLKLRLLRAKHGLAGLGLYWLIIELLYQESNTLPPAVVDVLAGENGVTADMVNSIINDFGLFEIDEGGNIYSPEVANQMEERELKQRQRTAAANRRWSANATAMRPQCDRNATAGDLQCIKKKRKEKKIDSTDVLSSKKEEEKKAEPSDLTHVVDSEGLTPATAQPSAGMQEIAEEVRQLVARDDVRLLIDRRTGYNCRDCDSIAAMTATIPEFAAQEGLKSANQHGHELALHFVNWLANKARLKRFEAKPTRAEANQQYADETERYILNKMFPDANII